MAISTLEKIGRKTGTTLTECSCTTCQKACKTPCLPTPEDVLNLMLAGYQKRLRKTVWAAGILLGVVNQTIEIVAPLYDEKKKACTFFTDGLCELHESGLKPTEGKLTHHQITTDPQKSIAWCVVQEWL